nr:reverse transcriptase domain-containing protein [Tanacetum cinerariifolium]
ERDADRSRNEDNSNDSGTGERRKTITPRECSYTEFLKCQPMNFQDTKGVVGCCLCDAMGGLERMITSKYCPRGEIKKLESEFWNLKVKGLDLSNYNHRFQELACCLYDAMGGLERMITTPADSPVVPTVDLVLSARETEALEADEPTYAPGSPISIPLSQTRLRKARKTVRPELPMSESMEASIARQ